MKPHLRILLLLLVWTALGQTVAWAAPTVPTIWVPVRPYPATQTAIPALTATSAGGVTRYNITTIMAASQGTVYVNGTAVTAAQIVTVAQASQLTFVPATGFQGNAFFQFTATDATGTSAVTNYSVPVSKSACSTVNNNSLDFSTVTQENWKAHANVTVSGTSLGTSAYSAPVATVSNILATGTSAQLVGQSLVWELSSTANDANAATDNIGTVTFTFSRPVTSLSIALQDIDAGTTANPGSDFIDELTFDGYATTGAATPITLASTNVGLATNNTNAFGPRANTIRGTAVNAALAAGTATVTFPSAVQKLVLTYRNTRAFTNGNLRLQNVGIASMSWCAQADVFASFTAVPNAATVNAGSTVTYTAQFGNNGVDAANGITRVVTLPAGAVVTSNGGGTVTSNTIDFGTATTLASGANNSFTYSYILPASGGTYTNVATASTSTEETSITPVASPNTANNSATSTLTVTTPSCQPSYLNNTTSSSGLTAEYYAGYFADDQTYYLRVSPLRRIDPTVDFSTGNGTATWGDLSSVATGSATDWNTYTSRYRGSIYITAAGSYTFYLNSDDASYMWLDGNALAPTSANATITNGGQHGIAEVTATVTLSAGLHDLTVVFGENGGTNSLKLEYASAANNISRQVIPQSILCAGPAMANSAPVANDVTNQGIINSAGATTLNANFSGTDPDGNGTLSYYNVVTLPASGGTLLYNGVAVVAGQAIPAASIGLLSFDPNTGFTGTATFTYTVTDTGGRTDLTPATYQVPVLPTTTVSGTIFEDVNYGGGAGRPLATAGTSARPGATVELYDASGNYQTSTTTDATGKYTFTGIGSGTYTVRVVDASVSSSRNTNNVAGLVPVQTFVRTGGTANDVNRVGGEVPSKVDAAVNPGVATFANRLTLAQLTAGNATPQSITTVTVAATPSPINTVDFGFNFDVITNTNDVGQGSLRQFITNANALPNTGLDQVASSNGGNDPVASVETSIFMVANGTARAGLRAGLANLLDANGVAVFTPNTATNGALPAITDAGTSLDGTTQTTNVGNTNNVTLGAGGNVGVNATALSQLNGPEVQIVGTQGAANSDNGLNIQANNTTVKGVAIYGFGNTGGGANGAGNTGTAANILVGTGAISGTMLTGNVIGTAANSFTDPGNTARTTAYGILFSGNPAATLTTALVSNNLIGYNGTGGIEIRDLAQGNGTATGAYVAGSSTGIFVENNEIRGGSVYATAGDGLSSSVGGGIVRNNLFAANAGPGIDILATTANVVVYNNTISGNGVGNAAGVGQTSGVRVNGSGSTISQNIISSNYGAGVLVRPTASATTISQNAIADNGTVVSANSTAASGQLGIDLVATGGDINTGGTSPFVTKNDNGDGDTGGNGLINFPVIQDVRLNPGGNLVLRGYAKPGATIEFYVAVPDGSGFGEGSLYLFTATEGVSDADAGTGSYSGLINGLDQGTETNQNRFSFSFLSTNFNAQQIAALQAPGARITSTATLSGQGTSEFSGNISLSPDVTTTITGPGTLLAGQASGNFTVAFSNAGSADAATVNQTVTLPAGATLTAAQLGVIQTTYVGATYSGGSGGTLTFPQAATLAAGASNIFQFAFTAPTAAGSSSIGSAVNTATTQSPNLAPDLANFPLTIAPVADVLATIIASATPVAAGTSGSFTATFTNNGPSAAAGTAPTVQLPAGLGTVTVSSTLAGVTGSYSNTTGVVTYTGTPLNSFANAATFNSVISYTQPLQGNVTATAAISTTTSQGMLSANGNPSTANDNQTVTNTGSAGFDLATTLNGPGTAVAGTQATYAVTTVNNGPGSAPSAIQTVSIPTATALTNVFLTNGGTYSFSGGTSLFTFPTIPALGSGQQVNNSISFTTPTGVAAISATALVTPNTTTAGDANTGNNQLSISTNLTTAPTAAGTTANLYVTIASNAPNGVAPNTPVVFTVTQANNGPGTATSVATQVYLPTGLTGVVVKDKNGNTVANSTTTGYNTLTGVVILPVETSEASANTPLTYTITGNSPASGVINATATVAADTNDPVPADNVALTAVTVNQPAVGDVTTTLNGPAVAYPGESIVYTVASVNNGTTAAANVTETVQLPAGLTGVVVKDANGNVIANTTTTGYNAATGLVTFASVASQGAGASVTRTITLPAPDNAGSATGGTIVPVAMVSSTSFDNVLANNSASVTTAIKPVSDFFVTLSGPATTVAGNPVTFTVTTTNNGPSVGGQQTTVQLPLGLDAAGGGLVLPTGATYSGTTGILTLAAVAAQGLGTANALTNSVTFNTPFSGVVLLAPTAQVTPATGTNDVNAGNNAATATTTVTLYTETIVDLATTVTSNAPGNTGGAGGTQTANQPITFTVTATNNTAAVSATNTVQQLALAAGLTGVILDGNNPTSTTNGISTYPGGATYNANTGVVTFAAATVVNGTPATHTVKVNAPGSGPLVATASVKSDRSENVTANNTASTSIAITPSADVLTSTTGPATTSPNTPVSYSVITTNNGPSAALNVVPTITLPAGYSNLVLPAGASLNGSIVTFATVGSLANGQSATNTLTFTSPAAAGSYTVNSSSTSTTVGAVPATADPAAGNNASSISTTSTTPTASPVAFDVVNRTAFNTAAGTVNSPSASTAGQNLISPLSAAASTGQSVASYTVTSIPTAAQGILYYNTTGTTYAAVGVGQVLTPAQAASLKFDPADATSNTTPVGDITFTYTATDNTGKVSNAANYTIQVGQDNNSVYTATPNKGAANQYQADDVIAFVIDPNGAAYNSGGLVYNASGTRANILAAGGNSGLVKTAGSVVLAPSGSGPAASGSYPANSTNVLPAGLSLDPITGLIYVSNRALLVNNSTVKFYQVNVVTTDIYGGTNVVTAQFSIGAYPLPVELKDFTATAVKNLDAALVWHTASEKDNDHFDVERSLNGTDFVKIAQVQGQGSSATTAAYALTDAGIGAKATGLVYYRLQQVDTDGTASFSPVRTVSFTKAGLTPSISLFPNPATADTKLDLTQLPAGRYEVSVLDATGRTVLGVTLEAGLAHALDLNTIASGTYTVLVRGQNAGQTISLTKRLIKE